MNWIKEIKSDFASLFHSPLEISIVTSSNKSFFENDYAIIIVKLKNMLEKIFSG